jgi:hydroxymethylbilane synthase
VETHATPADTTTAGALHLLASGARVGTGSLRRRSQLLSLRPDLRVELIRGNIDTRLRKLANDEFDAIILAYAGLHRAGMFDAGRMFTLSAAEMLPSPGQGALALQCRKDDARTTQLLLGLNDEQTATCVAAERALVTALQGDCHSPIAALAQVKGMRLHLSAAVGARNGVPPVIRAAGDASLKSPQDAITAVFDALTAQGVEKLLAG